MMMHHDPEPPLEPPGAWEVPCWACGGGEDPFCDECGGSGRLVLGPDAYARYCREMRDSWREDD